MKKYAKHVKKIALKKMEASIGLHTCFRELHPGLFGLAETTPKTLCSFIPKM